MTNKEIFIQTLRSEVKREGIEKVIQSLGSLDFFTAPASTKYHDAEEGGLCHHSLRVYSELIKLCDSTIPRESIAVVALLHDVCKVGFYTVSTRNVKDNSGKWTQVPYYAIDDKLPLGHGEKSVIMLLTAGLHLNTEEIMAIRWHMGGFENQNHHGSLSQAYSEYPLALYLHLADMKATYLKEELK